MKSTSVHSSSALIKKLMVAALLTAMIIIPSVQAAVIIPAPDITSQSATPNPFDPEVDGALDITWTHTGSANIEIKILNSNFATVSNVVNPTLDTNVNKPVEWKGELNNGQMAPEGDYLVLIRAFNNVGEDQVTIPFELENTQVTPAGDEPVISGDFASPNPFDPNEEDTTIFYTIDDTDDDATVTVRILLNGTLVETINNASESATNWDGLNISNNPLAEGVYTYEITATNDFGTDTETGTVEIEYEDGTPNPNGDEPVISGDFASPTPFDPNEEDTTIFYTIDDTDDDATVTVEIFRNGVLVETMNNASESQTNWDGLNSSNNAYSEGVYEYRITATNDFGTDTENGTVEIEYENNNGNNDDTPEIEVHYAQPNPFDADEENTRIFFQLNMDADVTVEIEDGGIMLRRIVNNVLRSEDVLHSVTWDGEDDDGEELDDDTYRYRITACNVSDDDLCNEVSGNIRIDRDGDSNDDDDDDNANDLITNIRVNDAVFDPTENEESEICFDIENDNTDITIEILDGSKVIRELTDSQFDEASQRCFAWDGEDDDNDVVDDEVYQYRVRAERGNDTQVELAYTEVDTDGRRIGFPDDGESCGGFSDVDEDSPFCRAIELMFYRGIFTGYSDGTFRPYADINRAEATKVILEALDYDIDDNDNNYRNLGFRDINPSAWYMPYLETARSEGIINGYPDGTFRPGATMNRVELLKVFLEATDMNIPYCNIQPYADTPVNSQTRWYIDYVCFAKAYGLMGNTYGGSFNPSASITRADVANLFYQFEIRGLFNGFNSGYYNNYYNDFSNSYNGNYNYYDSGYYNTYTYGDYNYYTPSYVTTPMYYY